jgi:hypothetical protein
MLKTTKDALRAILTTDQTVPEKERSKILERIFRADDGDEDRPSEPDKILRRSQVAQMLARSPRAVDMLARQGLLKKIKLPGRTRCAGFRASAVNSFLETAAQL